MNAKTAMRMEGRSKGRSDSRIRIPSAHLGSGPHLWPEPVTQTPMSNGEIEENKPHRLVRHGSRETGHTALAATGKNNGTGKWVQGGVRTRAGETPRGRKPR